MHGENEVRSRARRRLEARGAVRGRDYTDIIAGAAWLAVMALYMAAGSAWG